MIKFSATKADAHLINLIAQRAVNEGKQNGHYIDQLQTEMDLTACHLNDTPLNLTKLLGADSFNFWHDIDGIHRNINKATGKLDNYFLPRNHS